MPIVFLFFAHMYDIHVQTVMCVYKRINTFISESVRFFSAFFMFLKSLVFFKMAVSTANVM